MEERQAVANPVMYLQTALRADSVLPSSWAVSFARTILPHLCTYF
jgi:hypothetical protein